MPSPDARTHSNLIAVARSMVFAIGVVTFTTTWLLADAVVDPNVVVVTTSVAWTFVILTQGLPIAALFIAGEITRRRGGGRNTSFRALVLAAAVIFLFLHAGGETFERAFPHLPDLAAIRWAGLLVYLTGTIAGAVVLYRKRLMLQRYLAGYTELVGIVGVFALMFVGLYADNDRPWPPYYRMEIADEPQLAAGANETTPPVFVIVFDELSGDALLNDDGAIDNERFPNFARLAAGGVVFENARSNYFNTHFALPSLVEGLADIEPVRSYIQYGGADRALRPICGERVKCRGIRSYSTEESPRILAQLLISGAETLVPTPWQPVVNHPLGALAALVGVPTAIVDPSGLHLMTETHADRFLHDLETEDPHGAIYLFHTLASHYPYMRNESGDIRSVPVNRRSDGPLAEAGFTLQNAEVADVDVDGPGTLADAYLDQVAYADAMLGRIMDQLEARGWLDEAILVVTADHGVRPELVNDQPPHTVDDWLTRIPLLVSAPGIPSAVIDGDVQQVRLAEGIGELLSTPPAERPRTSLFQPSDERPWFVVHGRWVYHLDSGGGWQLVAERTEDGPLQRVDALCFAHPGDCDEAIVDDPRGPRPAASN
jgi:hypothetical protein